MTDEYYQKKRLEEMQKQTECMVNILKLLADMRDVGNIANVFNSVIVDSVKDKVSDRAVEHADKELKKLSNAMEKRWSE